MAAKKKNKNKNKKEMPKHFPFWARFKKNKNRTTLVIDEEVVTKKGKTEDCYVHREAIHTQKRDYEKIYPNPDKKDPRPMYLKRPDKKPKRMFGPHNKKLNMPESLRKRYEKNNRK